MHDTNLQHLVDHAPLGRFHWRLLIWCALMIVCDGYDLAIMGVALPSIMADMALPPAAAGMLASTALVGMMIGNIGFGGLAERIGRRVTIVICLVLFSVFTALAGLAAEPFAFGASRFVAGLGIGGMMPNVVAQMTEYAPRRVRSTMVAVMFSGYALGGMLAALSGQLLIAAFGWRWVFVLAGAPLLLAPFVMRGMPESMAWLRRTGRVDALRRLAAELAPRGAPARVQWHAPASSADHAHAGVRALFAEGRAISTLMFWTTCFMCLFMVYALSAWLAALMAGAGHGLGSALAFVFALNLGGVAGAIGGGLLADRFSIKRVLVGMYVVAGITIVMLGYPLPRPILFGVVALAGAATIGSQIVTTAYAGQFYAPAMRTIGVGWALGVGRVGAIAAPILIGALVGLALPFRLNFVAIAIPAAAAAVAIALIDSRGAARQHAKTAAGAA